MRLAVKLAAAGLSLATVVAVVGVSMSSATTEPRMVTGTGSCTTDVNGVCTLTHSLGVVPDAVVVSANTPGAFNAFIVNTVQGSFTDKTFKVRAMFSQAKPKAFGTIWVAWIASVGMGLPPATTQPPPPTTSAPSTTPPTTTMPPPSTTPPATTTPATTTPATTTTPAGPCAKPTVFAEQDGGDMTGADGQGYFVHNNAWNWQGGAQHETLYACTASSWWVDDYGFAPSNGEVFMYPNVHLDVNSMNGRPLSTWPNAITGKFAGVGPGAGSYDVAWDLWLNGVADKNSFELMVWTEKHGQADPAGTLRGTYTDPTTGQVYDVWWDGTHTDQAYLAYVSQKTQLSGTVDLRGMIVNAQKQGYLPAGDTTVNQIDYGDEVRDTQGATSAKPYRFTLTDFGLVMK